MVTSTMGISMKLIRVLSLLISQAWGFQLMGLAAMDR